MSGIDNLGNFSHLNAAESGQEERAVEEGKSPQHADSASHVEDSSPQTPHDLSGALTGISGGAKEVEYSVNVTGNAIRDIPDSVHTLSLPNSGKHMDEGFEHLAQKKNVQTLTISSEGVSEASIAKIPESLKQLHLVTNRAENPQRLKQLLQQIHDAHPKLTVTSESMADYNKKMGAGLKRGEGDLAFT